MRRTLANVLAVIGLGLLTVPAAHVATGIEAQDATPESGFHRSSSKTRGVAVGSAWGRIQIPRVGIDQVVFEGVTAGALRKGPGHVPGTAAPGSPAGNCVISAHRDSFFRALEGVREGDLVFVRGLDGRVTSYRLVSKSIVLPEKVSVMDASSDRRLTLITCYPFHFVGSAPYRLVWVGVAAGRRSPPSPSSSVAAVAER